MNRFIYQSYRMGLQSNLAAKNIYTNICISFNAITDKKKRKSELRMDAIANANSSRNVTREFDNCSLMYNITIIAT